MDNSFPLTDPSELPPSDWNDPTVDDITITLIKQYTYCPRVVYYETCTPDVRPTTYKMEAGAHAHDRERQRAARRTLSAYQIPEGVRHFDVRMRSAVLGLVGIVDEVVVTPDQVIVVDYKLANWMGQNHQMQLTAYGMLAEEHFSLPARVGYVYLLKTKRFQNIDLESTFRNSVLDTVENINRIRFEEYMPPPVKQVGKCAGCEFRRFCNDV